MAVSPLLNIGPLLDITQEGVLATGTVTSVSQGADIVCTPNPIIGAGTVAVAAASFVRADGTIPLTSSWNAGLFSINSKNSTAWFNARSYGALGNGVADDTAAIQATIDAATVAGGIAYLPGGFNYKITASLSLKSNVVLQGDGWGSTLVTAAATGFHCVLPPSGASSVGVVGIKFVGAGGAAANDYAIVTALAGATSVVFVRSCYFTNFSAGGVDIGPKLTSDVLVDGNVFVDNSVNLSQPWGIAVTNAARFCLCNNSIVRSGGPRTASGSNAAIDLEPNLVGDRLYNGVIANNTIINTSYGIAIRDSFTPGTTTIYGVTISGNYIFQLWLDGIIVLNANGCLISGNTIRECGRLGVNISTASHNTVTGNEIVDNNWNGGFAHVQLEATSLYNTVVGNRIGRVLSSTANVAAVAELTASDFNVITSNNMFDSGDLVTIGAHTSAMGHVGQNTGINTTTPSPGNVYGTSASVMTLSGISGAAFGGVFQVASNLPDGAAKIAGLYDWVVPTNTVGTGERRIVSLRSETQGATANDRGGLLRMYTKADGGALVARLVMDNAGTIAIGPGNPNPIGSGSLDIAAAVATRTGSIATIVNGLNDNVVLPASTFIRLSGPTGGFSLGGFTNPTDGRHLTIYNTVAQQMTLVNESATSTAANRIKTLTGANVVLRAGTSVANFVYDITDTRWILVSTN